MANRRLRNRTERIALLAILLLVGFLGIRHPLYVYLNEYCIGVVSEGRMPRLGLAARRAMSWPFIYSCVPLENEAVLTANDKAAMYLRQVLDCSSPQLLLYLDEIESIDKDVDLSTYTWRNGFSALEAAASGGSVKTFQYLLDNYPEMYDSQIFDSRAMRVALSNRNIEFVRFCFKHNLDANTTILAIMQDYSGLFERVATHPDEVSALYHGSTPLYWAVVYDSPEAIGILLDSGASLDELGVFTLQELAGYFDAVGVLEMYP